MPGVKVPGKLGVRSGQVRSGQVRSGQVRSGQVTSWLLQVSSDGPASPVLCGTNTGQHMYVEASEDCNLVNLLNFTKF